MSDKEQYKACTKCGQTKPCNNEYFAKHSGNITGLRPDCKVCHSERAKNYYLRNSDKLRQYQKDYISKNRSKISLRQKKNYQKNKQTILTQVKQRYLDNPEVVKNSIRNRHARKANVPHENYSWQDIIALHGDCCWLCGKKIDLEASRKTGEPGWENGLHLDHVIPILINGPDLKWNVQPTHGLCNLSRRKRL
jgi:hypothetical protein